jgi:hypothetical protein
MYVNLNVKCRFFFDLHQNPKSWRILVNIRQTKFHEKSIWWASRFPFGETAEQGDVIMTAVAFRSFFSKDPKEVLYIPLRDISLSLESIHFR